MRKSVFTIALLMALQISLTVDAQNTQVTLHVQNSVRQLAEKWVADYTQDNPNIAFQIVSGKTDNTENHISFVTEQNSNAFFFAHYAVLPVVNRASEAEKLLGNKQLNARKLKKLFFVKDEDDDEQEETKLEQQLHIITGNSQQSASRLYASHFHQETVNYKGKKIQGDDSFLNNAISRDQLGVTVNSLSNIFDLESRQLRHSLALIPLDIDRRGRQILKEGRLDDIIQLLEEQQYSEIPVGSVGLTFDPSNELLNDFAQWVLEHGVEYVHQYGLLSLSPKELTAQKQRIAHDNLAQNK